MSEASPSAQPDEPTTMRQRYLRFDRWQRLEHAVLIVSFTTLAVTGLAQKFAASSAADLLIRGMGGIEGTRAVHRLAAIILMANLIYHFVSITYRLTVRKARPGMMPRALDLRQLIHDVRFYFGREERKAEYGRFSYVEKAEYFALLWGMIIMVITGFMMWNPIATAQLLPGQFIPAAKSAHGAEALLAVLAIVVWHFYHVHIRHFNRSMFTGWLSREEMESEHPKELEEIESGRIEKPAREGIRRRERLFIPLATLATLILVVGLYGFVTFENTAIVTVPLGESAPAFSPQTPTPAPTFAPSPAALEIQAASWDGGFVALFDNRCGSCHGTTSVGGLSLATYPQALAGGDSGPGILPGNSERSMLVEIQAPGNHPGQLSEDELATVIEWINAGAPEN